MSKDKEKQLSRDWDYQYGIFARINGRSSWGEDQVKMYMDRNGFKYKKNDRMKQLIEILKAEEDKKYE